jgi:signal transduction histidine kinase
VALGADDAQQRVQLAREAMSNVARHVAASKVSVRVAERRDILRPSIIDDRHGCDPAEDAQPGPHDLTHMRARVESPGGPLIIERSAEGGTRVAFEVPRGDGDDEKESGS